MKSIVFLLFICVTFNWSSALPEDCRCRLPANHKIVKGKLSDLVPWQVSLQVGGEHKCSGIILDDETILTIYSTCVSGHEMRELSVVAGINRLDQRNVNNTYPVEWIILPDIDHFQSSGPNNTVILKLSKKLDLQVGKIEKACIRMYDSNYKRFMKFSQHFQVTGFGFDEEITISPDGKLNREAKPTNELKIADVKIDYGRTNDHSIYVNPRWFHSDSVCIFDEASPLMIQEKGKTKLVAFSDDLVVTDQKNGSFKVCNGKGAFIKFSAIGHIIEKLDTSNMCLEHSAS